MLSPSSGICQLGCCIHLHRPRVCREHRTCQECKAYLSTHIFVDADRTPPRQFFNIAKSACPTAPVILVGTKHDMRIASREQEVGHRLLITNDRVSTFPNKLLPKSVYTSVTLAPARVFADPSFEDAVRCACGSRWTLSAGRRTRECSLSRHAFGKYLLYMTT